MTSLKIQARATRRLTTALCLVALPSLVSSFGLAVPSRMLASQAARGTAFLKQPSVYRTTAASNTRFFSSLPEPGPCPECSDENSYWDGSTLFVCTACAHEWPVEDAAGETASVDGDDDNVTRDSNGNILEQGDMCVLIKDLAKGKLKKGLKVKLRLGDYGGGHDCEATVVGSGTYVLKSEFLKKI